MAATKRWALNGGPFGSKLSTKHYSDSGVPVIRGTNLSGGTRFSFEDFVWVSEETADELLPNNAHPGDLIFTQRGTIGQVGLIPVDSSFKRFVISQSQMKLTPDKSQTDALFLYYYFSDAETVSKIKNLAFAAGVPHINLEILRNFEVIVPPLADQRRIAGILAAYDELIENSQRRIRILESMARALYREWFVHFRFPGHEKQSRVSSPLGEIPEGWDVKKLGDVLELNYGKALKKEDRREGQFCVYGSSGVIGMHDRSLVRGPGIIVGRKGNVGSVFWCDDDFFVIDTAYFVTSSLPLRFLFYVLPSLNFINSDAAVPGLSRNQAYTLEVLVPPSPLLRKFCDLADSLERQSQVLQRQINNLRRTRDLLLPRLLSGQVELETEAA
ncbi:MAG: restriction endonuclease subunit S [Verrucomicrobia bacterium]|nr:restriction endonuclease subunit S [Verrucomicrobiota bacterium]